MSGDFLQNLITRYLGLDPTLQPRPTSRFEIANSVSFGVGIGENHESAPEPQNFQALSPIYDAPNREPRLDDFVPEHAGRERQSNMVSPSTVGNAAGERESELRYPDSQQSFTPPQTSATPRKKQNIEPLPVGVQKAETVANEFFSPLINNSNRKGDGDQINASEPTGLLRCEKQIEVIEASSDKRAANPPPAYQIPSHEIVSEKTSDTTERNAGYNELAEVVRQFRDEISTDKEIAVLKIRDESNLILPPPSVLADKKPLHSLLGNNLFFGKSNRPEQQTKPEPVINVTIGRIEVRAVQQADSPKPKCQQPTKVMSLDTYLRKRGGES